MIKAIKTRFLCKGLFSIILTIALVNPSGAQILSGLTFSGNNSSVSVHDFSIDSSGNQIFFGNFEADSFFISNQLILNDRGWLHYDKFAEQDLFLVQINKSGIVFSKQQIWSQGRKAEPGYNGGEGQVNASKMKEDEEGNIIVSGYFYDDTLYFGDSLIYGRGGSIKGSKMFLIKINVKGEIIWSKIILGNGSIKDIEVDENGEIMLTGEYYSSISFDSITLNCFGCHVHDLNVFIARYSSSGSAVWAKRISGDNFDYAGDLKYGGNGNYYLMGTYESTNLVIGDDTLTGGKLYFTKFDSSGAFKWAVQSKGYNGYLNILGLEMDEPEHVYVLGRYTGFGFSLDTVKVENPSGLESVFLAQFDSTGHCIWARSLNGILTSSGAIIVDDSNDIIISGSYYSDSARIGNFVFHNKGKDDFYVAKFDQTGVLKTAIGFGAENVDVTKVIRKDPTTGVIYLSGLYRSEVLKIGENTFFKNNSNSFVTYSFFTPLSFKSVGIPQIEKDIPVSFVIYPNPTDGIVHFGFSKPVSNASISVYNVLGERLLELNHINANETSLQLANFNDGVYFIRFIESDRYISAKVILKK